MGQIDHKKVIILCVCFALTSIFIYRQTAENISAKTISLRQALADVTGWKKKGFFSLDPRIVKALKLDNYTNQRYINGSDKVFLYIGYYLKSKEKNGNEYFHFIMEKQD